MGSDFLVLGLWIREGTEPDWQAGRNWIDQTPDADLEFATRAIVFDREVDESETWGHKDIRTELHRIIKEVEESFDTREVDWLQTPGYKTYVTGGMSGGDSPTDCFNAWNDLMNVEPLVTTIGFFQKKPNRVPA